MRIITTAILLLPFLFPSSLSAGQKPQPSPDPLGWHGETLPAGLVKAEREGEYRWRKDGSILVFVPAGSFPMGSEQGDEDEKPVHTVYLDGFYIDKYEVSWGQWKRSGLPFSESVEDRAPLPRAPDWGIVDEQPMLNVTWDEARAYLAWAGKRLPTEAEWEKAARGPDGRTYPWGDEPPSFDRAVWKAHPAAEVSTLPVDCCAAGASPYGAFNMAGNVYEWCEDVYDRTFYAKAPAKNPVNRQPGRHRVLRGGALVLEKEDLRSALRYRLRPEDRTPYIGFRGALSLKPGTP
jgi:formylglycine-generating enzyme required for sulfatase activity